VPQCRVLQAGRNDAWEQMHPASGGLKSAIVCVPVLERCAGIALRTAPARMTGFRP